VAAVKANRLSHRGTVLATASLQRSISRANHRGSVMAHRIFDRSPVRAASLRSRWSRHQLKVDWKQQAGKMGYILLWALGVPIPVLFLFYLLRGCT
jgi:hypothetical protein